MINKITRHMRCDCYGCKMLATHAIGTKGIEFPICEKHLEILKDEIGKLDVFKKTRKKTVTEVASVETASETKAAVPTASVPTETKEEVATEVGTEVTGVYKCKHCGKEFKKSEMTAAEFAIHCKECKKEH